jgi:protocatechuate 3,4-dioxygenase beta subunit
VVSSHGGSPIAGAKLELWPEYQDRGHLDAARATVFTDPSGGYRFQCDPPEHIHMRVSAAGYLSIAQNSYHPKGRSEGTFDIVLRPE